MAQSLIRDFAVDRDVVAIVGAGGKTTLAFGIASELRDAGRRVIVTTTTKMGADQDGGFDVVGPEVGEVAAALDRNRACLVLASVEGHKAIGVDPAWVDRAWANGLADTIVIEADGARRRKIKAPARYEPVVPKSATLVIAVMSATAVGGAIAEVAHRPEEVARVLGLETSDRLTEDGAAVLMASPRGGRKSVPEGARYVVAISGAEPPLDAVARRVADLLLPIPVVLLSGAPGRTD